MGKQRLWDRALKLRISEKNACILLGAALAALVAPLLWLGRYNVPCYDDFNYALDVTAAWNDTHSLGAVLGAAFAQTARLYRDAQGTFSGLFLMSLGPLTFGEEWYALVPWIMLAALCAGTAFFFSTLFEKVFGVSRAAALIAAFLTLMLQIELVPDAAQSFYWYNGSVYYTFMYALSLVLYSLLIRMVLERTPARRAALTAACTLLAVVQGGGNFVSGLVSALVLAGLLAGLAPKKHPALRWMLLPAAAFAASFAACLLAPGNSARLSDYAWEPNVLLALRLALGFMFSEASRWLGLPVLLILALLTPVFWHAARRSGFAFPLPGLVWIGSAALYGAMYCPSAYTELSFGPKRMYDIIFYGFILLWMVDWCYLVGWLAARDRRLRAEEDAGEPAKTVSVLYSACIAGVFALMVLTVGNTHLSDREPVYFFTSLEAVYSLRSGEAATYHAAFRQRLELLKDPCVRQVRLEEYPTRPVLLYVDDRQQEMARYYGKELIQD